MAGANVLLVGCGDIGVPLGLQLAAQGDSVWGLRRNPSSLPAPIQPLAADVTEPASLAAIGELALDYVIMTLTPAGFNDEGYRRVFVDGVNNLLAQLLPLTSLRRVFFVSSTSVYHQGEGQWVDEASPTQPRSFSGQRLLQGEQILLDSSLPVTVIRFAGIYGPGRRRLIQQVIDRQGCSAEPPLYTNRIHRDDCVGCLAHLLGMAKEGELLDTRYIGVDSEPVTLWDLKRWMATELGIDPGQLTGALDSRRHSKRCSNQRLLTTGYRLRYPGYQQGYRPLLAAEKNC